MVPLPAALLVVAAVLAALLLAVALSVCGCTTGSSTKTAPAVTAGATSGSPSSAAEPASPTPTGDPANSTRSTGGPATSTRSTVGGSTATGGPGAATSEPTTVSTVLSPPTTIFAVIGDYGMDDENEAAVAELVASWHPAYIITTGDDYYTPAGGKGTGKYDESTGAYYGDWLRDITTTGKRCPKGLASINAFFPALGNHDYSSAGIKNYLKYFDLPGQGFANSSGNERYYDFVQGPVHFFVLDSNEDQPHGTSSRSRQASWLKAQLAASTSTWNVVYDHHPPYSSDLFHGSTPYMQWPFAEWGADVVLSGHAHAYERIERDGVVYFVNGLGGATRYFFGLPIIGSRARYNAGWGAQRVTVTRDALVFDFWNTAGDLIDRYALPADRSPL
jgi:hypothetical protein